MKKIIFVILIIFISFVFNINICFAEENLNDYLTKNIDNLNLNEINNLINELLGQDVNLKDYLKSVVNKEIDQNPRVILKNIFELIKNNLFNYFPSCFLIIFICLLQSILNNLTSSFLIKEQNKIINFVCVCAITLILLVLIVDILKSTNELLYNLSLFMKLTFPILLTLMTSLNGINTATMLRPYSLILTNVISSICINVVLPLLMASIIIMIVSNMSDKIKLNKLTKFFKTTAKWILASIFSIFVTFLSMQGLTSGVVDTISIKTAKNAIGSHVPIVGEYLSEGYDLLYASLVIIKNSFGYICIIFLIFIIMAPVIKILILSLLLKLTSAAVEPVLDNKTTSLIYDLSNTITTFVSVIIGVCSMFLITILIICQTMGVKAI